jgi:hypothetical protein
MGLVPNRPRLGGAVVIYYIIEYVLAKMKKGHE